MSEETQEKRPMSFKSWVMDEQEKRTCETCGDIDCRVLWCRNGDGE